LDPSEDICKIKYTLTGPAVDYFRFVWDEEGVTFTNTTSTMVLDAAPLAMKNITIRSAPDNVIWIGENTLTLDAEYAEDIWHPNWPDGELLTPR